jgi:hypothetical protein
MRGMTPLYVGYAIVFGSWECRPCFVFESVDEGWFVLGSVDGFVFGRGD